MNTAMSQKDLQELMDRAVRTVTQQTTGVSLFQSGDDLGEDLCTVAIAFNEGFHTSITLCADTALLTRMAKSTFGEDFDSQDLEDFSKEYLNVLCGKVAAYLKEATQVAARFTTPTFYRGRHVPEAHNMQFALTYSDDESTSAQFTHHVPQEG